MRSKGVEAAFLDGTARGEFDHHRGAGSPVDLRANFDMPEELRLAYSVFRTSGLLADEVELLQANSMPEEQGMLAAAEDDDTPMARRLRGLHLKIGVLQDGVKPRRQSR